MKVGFESVVFATQRAAAPLVTVNLIYVQYIYGTAPDFGATVPEKRADIVGVYNIYVPIWHCSRFWGNCSQKTGRYSGGLLLYAQIWLCS